MSRGGETTEVKHLFELLFQAHPWHGVSPGEHAPERVTAYIEIVPTDPVKYELDKPTGHLRLDRPQRFSSMCPTLYGFVPQTFCGPLVGARCAEKTGRAAVQGDGDPVDICVISEKHINHGNLLLPARTLGGLRMIDGDEADDKIIAVLEGDLVYGDAQDVKDLPSKLVDRLRHYFLTYKQLPSDASRRVEIAEVYDAAEAREVVRLSMLDYRNKYGAPELRVEQLRALLGR